MQKNVSINIGGIIFHINENGYERLKQYLERINAYFSNFDESHEIISDIETRIAEIFLSKLSDGKQIITEEDIDSLIATLGNTDDFKAMESDVVDDALQGVAFTGSEEKTQEESSSEEQASADSYKSYYQEGKRLYRDTKRKILGGVAAGLANYFNVDALWFRIGFIVLFFSTFLNANFSWLTLLTYVVLWIVMPGSADLEEDKSIKKLYRNPDEKVIAGVSSGLAAYFGVNPAIFRLIFLIGIIPGGASIFAYIILWIITPTAETITEKMKMKGEPITLSNIEQNVKKSLKLDEQAEESVLTKILLFPFRLVAMFVEMLGKILGPLMKFAVQFVRVVAGIILIMAAITCIFALVVLLGAAVGIISNETGLFISNDLPLMLIFQSYASGLWWLVFGICLIPMIFLLLLGISSIANRIVFNSFVGWSLFAIWFICVLGFGFIAPSVFNQWRTNGSYTESISHQTTGKLLYLKVNEQYGDAYREVNVRLAANTEEGLKIVKRMSAHGSDRAAAINHAQMMVYQPILGDSVITLPSHFELEEGAVYRAQELEVELLIPTNQAFVLDNGLFQLLSYRHRNQMRQYNTRHNPSTIWALNENDQLICLSCPETSGQSSSDKEVKTYTKNFHWDKEGLIAISHETIEQVLETIDNEFSKYQYGSYVKDIDLRDFQQIDAGGIFHVYVKPGRDYTVSLQGRKRDVEDVEAVVRRGKLRLSLNSSGWFWTSNKREFIKVEITMPELEYINLSGAAKGFVGPFDLQKFAAELSGASTLEMNSNTKELDLDMSGASRVLIKGKANALNATVSSASNLNAAELQIETATIRASGASKVSADVRDHADIRVSGASKVNLKRKVNTKVRQSGSGKVIMPNSRLED
jgi:phage shock protein PspC (stress-responsive transcriptional regulator)